MKHIVAMRANKGFPSDFSLNADSFDAFYSKGTKPEQLAKIDALVDRYLGIDDR